MWKGRTAVVVGASCSVGEALARRLVLKHGMRVVCASRRSLSWTESLNSEAKAACNDAENFPWCSSHRLDIVKADECDALMKHAKQTGGPVDLLVNCSGITLNKLLVRTSHGEMENVLQTNVIGALNVSKAVLRYGGMPGSKLTGGCIIHIGSVVGTCGNEGQVVYAASKAALVGAAKSLAKEYGPKNVRVNVIAPGLIDGPGMSLTISNEQREAWSAKTPLRRLATPEDIVDSIEGIASCSYITGQVIAVDGGYS